MSDAEYPAPRPNSPLIGYRSFPAEYFTLLEQVEARGSITIGPFTKPEALAARRAFYRFRNALHEAPPDDTFARRMASVSSVLAIRIEGANRSWHLHFGLSPFVAAVRALPPLGHTATPRQRDSDPFPPQPPEEPES